MMFEKGMKLKGVFTRGEEGWDIEYPNMESITVEMVPGHMALWPWARVKFSDNKPDVLVNLSQCECVVEVE